MKNSPFNGVKRKPTKVSLTCPLETKPLRRGDGQEEWHDGADLLPMGKRRVIASNPEGADAGRVWVAKDKQGSGRRKKRRTTEDNRLAAPTVAK